MSGSRFNGASAVVTGAGSGIGAALVRALVARGANVTCTDIDGDAAERTLVDLSAAGSAVAAQLDVTDPEAVAATVDGVVAETGRIDYMFNNAGISWGGDTELLTLDHWNSIIDINIRGVVHGVSAAYPHMIRARSGHIVNTASMAGLVPAGLITSYVTTKHAIVGLSMALRSEARGHGVKVLALCPAAVETPLLDAGAIGSFDGRSFYLTGQGVKNAYGTDHLAEDTMRAIEKNKPLLVVPGRAKAAWIATRIAPTVVARQAASFVARQRSESRKSGWPT